VKLMSMTKAGLPIKIEKHWMALTKRERALIEYGRRLDPSCRHTVTIIYRGVEPWEMLEHVVQRKIELVVDS